MMSPLSRAYIHIGVGSNVVYSSGLGNARALTRGTDNSRFHAFFMSIGLYINAERQFFNLIFQIMDKNKQNEELQSRRDFFKSAAKSVLPILGAVVLASNPVIAKAAEKTSGFCEYSCSAMCQDNCSGGCKGTCTSGCARGCANYCNGGCSGGCNRTCEAYCRDSCSASCKYASRY